MVDLTKGAIACVLMIILLDNPPRPVPSPDSDPDPGPNSDPDCDPNLSSNPNANAGPSTSSCFWRLMHVTKIVSIAFVMETARCFRGSSRDTARDSSTFYNVNPTVSLALSSSRTTNCWFSDVGV